MTGYLNRYTGVPSRVMKNNNTAECEIRVARPDHTCAEFPSACARAVCDTVAEVEAARNDCALYEGAAVLVLLQPSLVIASDIPARHRLTLACRNEDDFSASIQKSNGNLTAATVRPVYGDVLGRSKSSRDITAYQVVSGTRRHVACKKSNVPLLAQVVELTDLQAFIRQEVENEAVALTPYELGLRWAYALSQIDADGKPWYKTRAELARAVKKDPGDVTKALQLSELPEEVVRLFQPLDTLQYRFAKPLHDAARAGPELLLAKAQELERVGAVGHWTPKRICNHLCGTSEDTTIAIMEIRVLGRPLIAFSRDKRGRLTAVQIPFELKLEARELLRELAAAMRQFY